MPPEPGGGPPTKLSVVVFSGDYGRVHYALAMAASAAAINRPVTLFFTMEGLRALLPRAEDGTPGWAALEGAGRDADFARNSLATFEELLGACAGFGVTIMVCEMGLKAEGLEAGDLRQDIKVASGGIVTFLNDASRTGALLVL